MPAPLYDTSAAALPDATPEALAIARRYVHADRTIGGDYRRISYRPPGVRPGGPDLLYRAAEQGIRADETAEHLVRLLAPLVDVALVHGRASRGDVVAEALALGERGPDGPGDALDHRHDPPRLGMDVIVGDEGEVA